MKICLVVLLVTVAAFGRVRITSYSLHHYGNHTASGQTLKRNELTCAVNRDSLFGKYVWLKVGFREVRFFANDKFNSQKFKVSYMKFDLTQRGYDALGIGHTAWGEFVRSEVR